MKRFITGQFGGNPRTGQSQDVLDGTRMTAARRRIGAHQGLVGGLAALMVAGLAILPAAAASADTQASHFIQIATSSNSSGDSTYINDGATNGNPNAVLFVSPNWSPGGECPGGTGATNCVSDTLPVGVWYDSGVGEWAIFQEDGSNMPVGAAFNVLVEPATSSNVIVQTATGSNTNGDSTYIDSGSTNGNPDVILQATQVWNPGDSGGTFNDHSIGVWYNAGVDQWAVFQEDLSSMTSGASFNILIGSTGTGGGKAATQTATTANRGGDSTHINSTVTNGDSNAFVLDTPNYDPKGVGGTLDTSQTGVWYLAAPVSQEVVFNESTGVMKAHEAFNVMLFGS